MAWLERITHHPLVQKQPELIWLLAGITLSVIPHVARVPIWIPVLFFLLIFWCVVTAARNAYSPGKKITSPTLFKILVSLTMITGVFLSYGTLTGRDAGVALLILLAGIKLIELGQKRDYYIAVFITLLLVLTNFFYSQTITIAVYMAITMLVIVGTLIGLNDGNHKLETKDRLRVAGLFLLQAVPLMLILFLFFPRLPGPLWGLPKDAYSAQTGITDEMSPGSINQLAFSDDVAFRVEFDGAIPDKSRLYWRGPVLTYTDGVKWIPDRPRRPSARVTAVGKPYTYSVTLEPTEKNWLYGLEMPKTAPDDSYFSHELQIRTRLPVRKRIRYRLTSYTDYRIVEPAARELSAALQLPPGYHPKTVALGRSWQEQGMTNEEIIQRALSYFNREEFYYTVTPPLLLDDPVDEFLFQTRRGFCEHYAAAFVILMRAAGIPARVVTGYQGGEINPVGNYLIVRQRDAHAWTEVWLGEKSGWVRVDPTSAVSPARVNNGIEQALPDSVFRIPLGLQNNVVARDLWKRFNNTWDAINNRWNQWVLGYDEKNQLLMLERIGLSRYGYQGLMLGLVILFIPCLLFIAVNILRQTKPGKDEARRYYQKFLAKLARCGIRSRAAEGPEEFARRASRIRFDLAESIRQITATYIEIRYGSMQGKLETLKEQISNFHPSRRPLARGFQNHKA